MEEDIVPVPSMLQVESESQFYKHVIVVHVKRHEEKRAGYRGPQGKARLTLGETDSFIQRIFSMGPLGWWELARQGWEKGMS